MGGAAALPSPWTPPSSLDDASSAARLRQQPQAHEHVLQVRVGAVDGRVGVVARVAGVERRARRVGAQRVGDGLEDGLHAADGVPGAQLELREHGDARERAAAEARPHEAHERREERVEVDGEAHLELHVAVAVGPLELAELRGHGRPGREAAQEHAPVVDVVVDGLGLDVDAPGPVPAVGEVAALRRVLEGQQVRGEHLEGRRAGEGVRRHARAADDAAEAARGLVPELELELLGALAARRHRRAQLRLLLLPALRLVVVLEPPGLAHVLDLVVAVVVLVVAVAGEGLALLLGPGRRPVVLQGVHEVARAARVAGAAAAAGSSERGGRTPALRAVFLESDRGPETRETEGGRAG